MEGQPPKDIDWYIRGLYTCAESQRAPSTCLPIRILYHLWLKRNTLEPYLLHILRGEQRWMHWEMAEWKDVKTFIDDNTTISGEPSLLATPFASPTPLPAPPLGSDPVPDTIFHPITICQSDENPKGYHVRDKRYKIARCLYCTRQLLEDAFPEDKPTPPVFSLSI